MSDSVANLTVKVDVKSVKDATAALLALSAAAAKVEKSVGGAGAFEKMQKGMNNSLKEVIRLEKALQQAQTRVAGIMGRAERQLSREAALGISAQSRQILDQYTLALRKYGITSLEAAKAKGEFNRATQALSGNIAKVGGLLPRLNDNARTISAAFGAANASVGGFSRAIFNTSAALSALTGALALREITQSIMEFERFTNTLRTVSVSASEFSKNLNFLFGEANRIGFAVGEVGNSFARLSLAMQGAGFNANESRQAFSQLAEASRNFGLSSADTMGVIRALEQSMSKGKFMAEEVRLQMGDRLPVAMAALERAVTKVDGKQSDLNKRFEEGSIDTRRYALEFVRQINAMSGGADALSRTSNSIAAALGRLNTEFVLTTKAFGEGGFSNAVIILTQNLTSLFQTLREVGVITAAGAAMEFLAKQTTLLTTAVLALSAALATSLLAWAVKAVVALSPLARIVAAVAAGIGLLVGAIDKMSSSQRLTNELTAATNNLNLAHREGVAIAEGFTDAIRKNTTAVDSSTSPLEKRIQFLRQIGITETDVTRIVAEEEGKRLQIKLDAARVEMAAIQNTYSRMREREVGFSNAIANSIKNSADAAIEAAKRGQIALDAAQRDNLTRFAATWDSIRQEVVSGSKSSQDAYNEFAKAAKSAGMESNESVRDMLDSLLKLAEAERPLQGQIALIGALERAMENLRLAAADPIAFRVSIQTEFPGEDPNLARTVMSGLNFNRYTPIKVAQDRAAGEKVLQEAYRQVTGDVRAVADSEKFLARVRADAAAGVQGAQKILDDYNEALAKNDTKTRETAQTLEKYLATLRAQIENQDRIAAAYRTSTQAGEDAELQLKAETEAIRLGAKTEEQRIALKKQILPLLQKEAEGEKSVNAAKDLPRMRDEIALLEKEQSLLGQSVTLREQDLAVLRARQQYRGASPEDLSEIERLARRTVEIRQQNQFLENSYNELANIGARAFEQVGDAITEAFSKGEMRALRFGDIVRGVMSSIIQSIIRLGIINPILNSVFGGTLRPTLFAGMSVAGGAAAAGAAGGGGGIMDLLGLSSLIPKEGILGSLGLTGPGGLLSTSIFAPSGVSPAAASLFMDVSGVAVAPATGGLTLGGLLGGAGAGIGAGMFLNSMLGGNQTGGMVGSGLGAVGGALLAGAGLLGPLGPLAAGLIGGLAGGGLGGLIGPKPSVQGYGFRLQSAGYGPDATPANAMATSLLPISRQFYNESGAAAFQQAEQVVAATNAYLAQRGLLVGGVSVVGGNRFGPDYSWADAGSIEEAFTRLRFGAGSNTELNRVLSGRTFGGLEPLQQFVEGFVSLQDTIKSLTADPVPEFTQQMNALIDSFAQATVKAREYEYGEEELAKARDKQIAKLQEQRNLTIRDTALELEVRRLMAEGMEQEAQRIELAYRTQKEIESFTASLDTLGITAEEKSRLLVELERTQAAERVKVLQDANKNIRDYLDSLRTGALSGTTTVGRLSAAEEIFTRDLALAQAGNVDALNRITQSADTLLNLARETYASTSGFHTLRGRVVSSLEALSAAPASVGLANLSSVPLVSDLMSMRENAAVLETAEYTKQFDSKMAELLPIAQAIQTAVEQTSQVTAAAYGSDTSLGFFGGGGEQNAGGFGDMGGGGGGGGMAAALGAALYQGRVMAYANGGIPDLVNSPTLAPMALFGEAGPEAIMPLRRGPDGRLGVEVNGGGSQAVVAELRAVRNEIINLRGSVEEADSSESGGVVEAIAELRIQIGGLREELRTTRLRAQ